MHKPQLPNTVMLSEAKDLLRWAQRCFAALSMAVGPYLTAELRLRLMPIEADESAMGAINRPLQVVYLIRK